MAFHACTAHAACTSPAPQPECPPSSRPVQKWGCFSCASPFSCKQRLVGSGGDSDEEVVRRNDSTDGFVIRRKQSFPPPSSPARDRSASGRLK